MYTGEDEFGQPLTNQWFTTTHWTVVLAAKGSGSPHSAEALNHLCRTYWGALYACARRQGRSPADAADLTQEFFVRFLEKEFLKGVDPNKGKFRSFLLKAFNHFIADEWKYSHAQKRSGSHPVISIDADEWETCYGHELASDATPEKIFERRWALALFEQALARLRNEYMKNEKGQKFELLKQFLSSPSNDGAFAAAATKLGSSKATLSVQVHRLRKRYGRMVRDEVARTVASTDEVEEELRHLLDILSE